MDQNLTSETKCLPSSTLFGSSRSMRLMNSWWLVNFGSNSAKNEINGNKFKPLNLSRFCYGLAFRALTDGCWFNMEKCSFGEILGSNCGSIIPPEKDTFVDEIISLEYCKKDILGHMKQLQLSRSEITTEAELILCRAGKTFFFSFQICRW